jgi:hypothetical protein
MDKPIIIAIGREHIALDPGLCNQDIIFIPEGNVRQFSQKL